MSGRVWVYSDPHFYHKNIVTFTNADGTKVRPWDDADVMTEDLIRLYNETVDEGDRVYILGDVAFNPGQFRNAVSRLKGRKVLIPGNHEPKRFDNVCHELGVEVRGYVVKKGFIMSHIPIHPGSLSRWRLNIHGHLHNNTVKMFVNVKGDYIETQREDERYYCACVERTDFRPILLDTILKERGIV